MFNDLIMLWFRPTTFFATRFSHLDSFRIRLLGFLGVLIGLGLGSLNIYLLSTYVIKEFSLRPEEYLALVKNLGLNNQSFVETLGLQKAYALVLGLLSPVIAFMAPHILGGAVFAFLWLLMRGSDQKLDFTCIMDCASVSLAFMVFYAIPAVGPLVALFMIGINLSRALFIKQALGGFMKTMGIIMAMYISFFVAAASLQLLAVPVAAWFKF
jgi:hypothetical protein